MSNHMHLLVSPGSAERLAAFMKFVNGNISARVGKLVDWPSTLWGRRYQAICVVDEASQVERLRYCLEHGCKEGLVARPEDWPGVSSARSLRDGQPLIGRWTDTRKLYQARRRKGGKAIAIAEAEFETEYRIELSPLPCWAGMTDDARRKTVGAMLDEIAAETARAGRRAVGRMAILDMHPHYRPLETKHSPAPRVHAATRAARDAFRDLYRNFVDAYRRGIRRILSGARNVRMPEGCILPSGLPLFGAGGAELRERRLLALTLARQRTHQLADDAKHDLVGASADREQSAVAEQAGRHVVPHEALASPVL
jgi:hypothetical protein